MAFARLFGAEPKTAPAKAAEVPQRVEAFELYPPRTPHGLDPGKLDDFARRIAAFRKHYATQRDGQRLGSLQIYSFDRIRLRLGRRWESVRDKVFGIIENAIAKRLGENDLYVAVSEDQFYVLVASAGRPDAELRGARLATDITDKLLGTLPGGAGVTFKTVLFDFQNGLEGVTTFSQLTARIEAFSKSVDEKERTLFEQNSEHLQVFFKPTINLKKSMVMAYEGLVGSEQPEGRILGPETICPSSFNGVFDAMHDGWMLQRISEVLQGPFGRTRAQLILPVHYETLASMRFRENFLSVCRKLPGNSSRQLVFNFCDLSPGMPQSRVRELAAYLRPFCSALVATLPPSQIYTEHLDATGVKAVILNAGSMDEDNPSTAETLSRMIELAKASGLRTAISNTKTVSFSHQALGMGVDYLNGDALMKPLKQPAKVMMVPRT